MLINYLSWNLTLLLTQDNSNYVLSRQRSAPLYDVRLDFMNLIVFSDPQGMSPVSEKSKHLRNAQ